MEVVWKTVVVILNRPFTASIAYHNSLHGFWVVCSTGTTTFKLKLLQQVASMREEVLHTILLDLHKTYDALDRSRFLEILEGYGVGSMDLPLLRMFWERLQMVAQARGYYREPLYQERGVM